MAFWSILRSPFRKKSNKLVMCPHHEENKAVLICLRPECNAALACVECVAANHQGHVLEKLETHATEKKLRLKDKVKAVRQTILDPLTQMLETTKNKISSNKTQTKYEQQKIFNRCNALKSELDEIARACSESCEITGEENEKKLTEHMKCLESIYTKYKSQLDKCEEVIEEGSDSDIVHAEIELPDAPDIPPFPDVDISIFKSDSLTSETLEDLFGEVISMLNTKINHALTKPDISSQPGTYDASALPTHSMNIDVLSKLELEGDTEYVCGLLFPSMRKLLYIWFIESKTVSVVTHDGKVTDIIPLQQSAEPDDEIVETCVSPVDETLWSLSHRGLIQQVKQDGTQLQSITYFADREEVLTSMCVTRSQEVVVGVMSPSQVIILTAAGAVTRTLNSYDIGLISYPISIVQCQTTGRFALTEVDRVSVVDEKYNHLFTLHGETVTSALFNRCTGYTCEELFHTRGMCFDEDSNLLVVDKNNCSVVMFSPSGQYIQTIVKETDENAGPVTINTAPDSTLWVAYSDDVFRQIKYK